MAEIITDFRDYYNQKKLEILIDENDYDDLLIQFDELDYKVKNELSKKYNLMKNLKKNIFGIMSINWISN